jgi:hypothetical protein
MVLKKIEDGREIEMGCWVQLAKMRENSSMGERTVTYKGHNYLNAHFLV